MALAVLYSIHRGPGHPSPRSLLPARDICANFACRTVQKAAKADRRPQPPDPLRQRTTRRAASEISRPSSPHAGHSTHYPTARSLQRLHLRADVTVYDEKLGISGLNYLSLTTGYLLGSTLCALSVDRIYRHLSKRVAGQAGKPEFRLPLLTVSAILVPGGLLCYGWSAQAHIHWMMPNLGIAIFAAGAIIAFQCVINYILDAYPRYTASAVAAITFLRALAGTGFPLFAPKLYEVLRYGWGNSVLAFAAILLGFPAPLLLWRFGESLRSKSQYAAGDVRE